jgi:hypothetical protein
MHQRFSARWASKNQFYSLFERDAFAARRVAIVKIMILLIFHSDVKFLKYAAFLAQYETFELVRLESPMEDEPSRFRVTCSSKTDKRMII